MELGEKLRQARLEAGLSQRQLCGEEITRNMLSLIEHGAAKPSMKTLQYLSARLGKSVSFFLDETAVVSPNQEVMASARRLFDNAEFSEAALVLEAYQEPDSVYDREKGLLQALCYLSLAERAIREDRPVYARELLEKIDFRTAYCADDLVRRRALLLGQLGRTDICSALPSLDPELKLRAAAALESGDPLRAGQLLDAAEDKLDPHWNLCRGNAYLSEGQYREAAQCFHVAENTYPEETTPALEHCYRELEDYRRAYEYACRRRKLES